MQFSRLNRLLLSKQLNGTENYIILTHRIHTQFARLCLLNNNTAILPTNQILNYRWITFTPIYRTQTTIANDNQTIRLAKNKLQRSVTSDLMDELSEDVSVIAHRNPNPFETRIDNEFLDQIGPTLPKSYNVAAFVNKSYALQQLVKLGVNLYEIESTKENVIDFMIKLDFDNNIAPYIQFLHDNGLPAEQLGRYFTKNPLIFKQSMANLQQRIDYLRSKKFDKSMIAAIITKAPKWLCFTIEFIDAHLGFLQKEYQLSGEQIRHIVVMSPRVTAIKDMHLRETSFAFREEMGFTLDEMKKMIMTAPYLLISGHKNAHKGFLQVFDFVHNEMKISHKIITECPQIFTRRVHYTRERHLYLKLLKRDQYNPEEPLYVPLSAFYAIDDIEFCEKYARTSVGDFNEFLKTL